MLSAALINGGEKPGGDSYAKKNFKRECDLWICSSNEHYSLSPHGRRHCEHLFGATADVHLPQTQKVAPEVTDLEMRLSTCVDQPRSAEARQQAC
jgi:hypothetical protein